MRRDEPGIHGPDQQSGGIVKNVEDIITFPGRIIHCPKVDTPEINKQCPSQRKKEDHSDTHISLCGENFWYGSTTP
jgi:hypothetical protein